MLCLLFWLGYIWCNCFCEVLIVICYFGLVVREKDVEMYVYCYYWRKVKDKERDNWFIDW